MFVINNILEMMNFMFDNNELFLVMYAVMIYVNYWISILQAWNYVRQNFGKIFEGFVLNFHYACSFEA